MNILDVVPVKYSTTKVDLTTLDLNEIKKCERELKQMLTASKLFFKKGTILDSVLSVSIKNEINRQICLYNELRKEIFEENGFLPDEFLYKKEIGSTVSRINNGGYSSFNNDKTLINSYVAKDKYDTYSAQTKLPSASIGDLKNICNKFNFIIIPYDYFTEVFYNNDGVEDRAIKDKVFESRQLVKDGDQCYVMCPLEYYSIEKHVKSSTNKFIYSGNNVSILGGVLMQIPMLQSFNNRMDEIENNVDIIKTQVNSISMQLNQIKEQQIIHELELKKIQRIDTRRKILPKDPLLFSLPSNVDINDNNNNDKIGKIMYSWGPDFDDAVIKALEVISIDGNRSEIENIIRSIFG